MSDEVTGASIHAAVTAWQRERGWDNWGRLSCQKVPIEVPGLGLVTVVYEYDGDEGYEDWGGVRYFIFTVAGSDRLWRKDGRYRSHEGTDWDDWAPPYPVTETVVSKMVYERQDD